MELVEVISLSPAICPNRRSSGVATLEAMVAGSAPGRLAETWTTGNSTLGSGATGSRPYATIPSNSAPSESSVVATGRRMNGSETFMFLAGKVYASNAKPGPSPDK